MYKCIKWKCTLFLKEKEKSTYIPHVWSLCIVKEAMFIILIGLWPIRLFISDLYISGTHNFLIYIFYFTFFFFFLWEILLHGWVLRDAAVPLNGCCFIWQNSGVLRQLCVHNYNNYDDENNKDIYFTFWCWVFSLRAKISVQAWIKNNATNW